MNREITVEKATFTAQTGSHRQPITVHFNPASLEYTITNSLEEQGEGNSSTQYISSSTAKLTMQLIFDTTHSGDDVRGVTGRIATYMRPVNGNGERTVPAIITFAWGVYTFQGMLESFKETIDFFSPEGVPLRSTVDITMSSQNVVFSPTQDSAAQPNPAVEMPQGQSAVLVASNSGNPQAGRAIAAANNHESMRFNSGTTAISGSVQLTAAASFSAGTSLDAGIGAGLSAGIGGGGEGGLSAGGSLSAGAGIGGGASVAASASTGVSASTGAFAGLTQPKQRKQFKLDTEQALGANASISFKAHPTSDFAVGGRVNGGGSLSANLKPRIQFEENS